MVHLINFLFVKLPIFLGTIFALFIVLCSPYGIILAPLLAAGVIWKIIDDRKEEKKNQDKIK